MAQQGTQMPLLHPILRIIVFVILSIVLALPFSLAASILAVAFGIAVTEPQEIMSSPTALLSLTCYFYLPVLLAMLICRRLLDRASFSSLGIAMVRQWHAHLLSGFLGGFAMAALATLICLLIGEAHLVGFGNAMLFGFAFYLLSLCFQSGMEELTMRGYMLQNLLTRFGVANCVIVTSLLFSLLHLLNFTMLPTAKAHTIFISLINIGLFGAVAALLVIRTGALWAAIGLHWGWNFSCGFIFGSPVSGLEFHERVVHISWHGNEILTGGSFGLEGSIIVTAMLTLTVLWLARRWRCEPNAWWMRVRTLHDETIA